MKLFELKLFIRCLCAEKTKKNEALKVLKAFNCEYIVTVNRNNGFNA